MRIFLLKLLLAAILLLTPIIPAQYGFGYELVKILVFLVLVIVSGLIFTSLVVDKKITIRWTRIKLVSLLFVVCLTITSFSGVHPTDSLTGQYPYFQGLIVYWLLFLFSLIVSGINPDGRMIRKAVIVSATLVAVLSCIQFLMLNVFEIDIINYSGRVVSTFGQPNLYSGFLLLTLPWVVLGKKPNWLVFLIIFSGIIVSLSKASVILGVGLGIYLISRKIKSRRVRILLLLVTLLSFLVIGVLLPGGVIREEIIRPLTSNKIEENHIVEKRIYILPVIFRGSLERPFAGFGLDSIDLLYRSQFADFKPEIRDYPPKYFNLMNLAVDRSHNYFLDLFVFAGILGLGFYLYLNYLLLKKPAPIYLKITLVLYLVWVQFQVQSIVHLIFFWLILGLIDKIKKLSDDEF